MEESYHIHDGSPQQISCMRLSVLESPWEIEWIDTLIGVEIDIEVRPSYRIDERSVLVLRIEDDDVCPEHEGSEDLELDGK